MEEQAKYNIFFSAIHISLTLLATYCLWQSGRMPIAIPTFDFIILILATFRLTRLFVYDHIMEWFRHWFMVKTMYDDGTVLYLKPENGIRLSIATLLNCPWCVVVWMALPVTYLYFASPFAWYPLFIFAVSGAAALLQVAANLLGWHAEGKKREVQNNS